MDAFSHGTDRRRLRLFRARSLVGATVVCLSVATPGAAEGWSAPEGCETFLTVQFRECRISNYYRCAAEPAGHVWRADFDVEGLRLLTLTDAETLPLRQIDPREGTDYRLDTRSIALPSQSSLLSERTSIVEYRMVDPAGEGEAYIGLRFRITAQDQLPVTYSAVTIDGVELQEVAFNLTRGTVAGVVIQERSGTEYVHSDWRLVFSGPEQTTVPGNLSKRVRADRSPVDFIFPGEPKFGSTMPIEDCELLLSQADIAYSKPTFPSDREGMMP